MKGKYPRYGLAAMLLSFFLSLDAHAACGWSQRTSLDDAECLSGSWENRTWPRHDTAKVKNECHELGKVVAKVDRQHAADWTLYLRDGNEATKSGTAGNIRGIHCCRDLSELCNRTDVINPDACIAQYNASPAHNHEEVDGYGVSVTATDVDAGTCTFRGDVCDPTS